MIKNIFPIIALLLTVTLYAQTDHNPRAEQIATEMLTKASNKLKSFRTLEVEFSYKMENTSMEIVETMSGKVYSKGDKYRMIVGDNVFISDGETVWNYLDDMYEIHINYVENMEGGLTPTALLDNFDDDYRGRFVRQETFNGKTVDIIDLIPNTPQSFFKYRVALDAGNHMLVYTVAYDRHGGTYTYTLGKTLTNHEIDDKLFVFNRADFPADTDIIDLR
jgi:outer membrane lipoprotein carrier protein